MNPQEVRIRLRIHQVTKDFVEGDKKSMRNALENLSSLEAGYVAATIIRDMSFNEQNSFLECIISD